MPREVPSHASPAAAPERSRHPAVDSMNTLERKGMTVSHQNDETTRNEEWGRGDTHPPPTLTAQEARQGQVVLNTRTKRAVFLAAFVLMAVFALIGLIAALI
jgi:hypothetical protein